MSRKSILLVDNYDSFTHNIAHALGALGVDADVVSIDDHSVGGFERYQAVVLGPGPGLPHPRGKLARLVSRVVSADLPLLGICLGMQAIAVAYGARIVRAPRPVHGELASIEHERRGVFAGVPSPFRATRYHSLCVAAETMPVSFHVSARSEDGVIQGIRHHRCRIFGVQFHPESFLSEYGDRLLANFVSSAQRVAADI
jgi:anthranilate synthase/aminodeoxychorismate synthase-like glutamine amidotransferase